MAIYNEILVGRYNRALQKFLSMKGPVPAPQIASEFMAVFPFFFGAENRYLESWSRYGNASTVVGGAGQFGALQLRNPLTSNIVVVIEKVTTTFIAADQVSLSLVTTNADMTTLITSAMRWDSRGNQKPSAMLSGTTNFTRPGAQQLFAYGGANTTVDSVLTENQELTLLPGDALQVWSNTAAGTLGNSWIWRERTLEESERT